MIAATLLPQDVFGHVVSAQADGLGSALMLLDLHAQGPPVLPLI
jgi:hypothetical protein